MNSVFKEVRAVFDSAIGADISGLAEVYAVWNGAEKTFEIRVSPHMSGAPENWSGKVPVVVMRLSVGTDWEADGKACLEKLQDDLVDAIQSASVFWEGKQ